jgi:predicted esterase
VIWWRFADTIYNENRITILPVSWRESMWWQYAQVENLDGILDLLKQEYNIDENRVYMFGVSDGGTGIYYYASKNTTPWAAFIPVIGSPGVLNNPVVGTEGQLYAVNISNKPFLVFNGGLDPLYPASTVQPFVDLFAEAGCNIRFQPKPSFGHTAEWWDKEEEQMERFMKEHPRVPYPDSLAWETEDVDRFGRAHWLVITRLGTVQGESGLNPWNVIRPSDGSGKSRQAFSRKHPSGRVELHKKGNRVDAFTQGVKEFKLLISPRAFDFQRPIEVFTNGVRVFSGKMIPDPAVLLKWAARDNDRTMLFGAEITIAVRGLSL